MKYEVYLNEKLVDKFKTLHEAELFSATLINADTSTLEIVIKEKKGPILQKTVIQK